MSEHHEVGADFNSGLVGEASTRVARDFSLLCRLAFAGRPTGGPRYGPLPAPRGAGPVLLLGAG